uniref:Uncharacterized protein n=1 Tax=viral metagenome TaxID=1070528 RepID=A0A6C0I255_9ZZZZ
MSYFFRYNKLIEDGGKGKEADKNIIVRIGSSEVSNVQSLEHDTQPQHATTDSQTLTVSTLVTNLDEFKILFLTQEKLCYELRAENAILTNKLEMTMSISKKQLLQIKRLKLKMCKLETANETFEKILGYSNYSKGGNNFAHPPPPPPPPPPPLFPPPPPLPLNTSGVKQKFPPKPMNTVLEEFKLKFKPKD